MFYEASAQSGENVSLVFNELAKELIIKKSKEDVDLDFTVDSARGNKLSLNKNK